MAEVAKRSGGRRTNRRRVLDEALRRARNGREVLAAASQYFRSTFAREDDQTIMRMARELIDMTDREAGERP